MTVNLKGHKAKNEKKGIKDMFIIINKKERRMETRCDIWHHEIKKDYRLPFDL